MDARARILVDAALAGALLGAGACAEENPRFVTMPVVSSPVGTADPSTEPLATTAAPPRRRPPPPAVISTEDVGDDDDYPGKHACKGQNDCKGQGNCKTMQSACKGQNACKGQGGCKSP